MTSAQRWVGIGKDFDYVLIKPAFLPGILDTAVPAIENLPLNDIASLKDGYHTARKFTSCVSQEIREVKSEDGDGEGEQAKEENGKEMVGDYHVR